MYLKEYLNKNKIPHTEFARDLGISYVTLWRIMEGKNNPSYPLVMKIYSLTKRKVGLDEIVAPFDRARTRIKKSPKKNQKSSQKQSK